MKTILISLFFLITFIRPDTGLRAQNDNASCTDVFAEADRLYEAGKLEECVAALNNCISSVDAKDRYLAHRMLAICYLDMHRDSLARTEIVQLLKKKPEYLKFPFFDPAPLRNELARYQVRSLLELGWKGGFNLNMYRGLKSYSPSGQTLTYFSEGGFQAGIMAEYFLNERRSLQAELLLEELNYSCTGSETGGWDLSYRERLRYATLPVVFRYRAYTRGKLAVVPEAGLQARFFLNSIANIRMSNTENGDVLQSSDNPEIRRKGFLISAAIGASVQYKLNRGTIGFNIRYLHGLNNMVDTDNRNGNVPFILNNHYLDSDMIFCPLQFSLTYQMPLAYKVSRN